MTKVNKSEEVEAWKWMAIDDVKRMQAHPKSIPYGLK
jgi:hypothetical protein